MINDAFLLWFVLNVGNQIQQQPPQSLLLLLPPSLLPSPSSPLGVVAFCELSRNSYFWHSLLPINLAAIWQLFNVLIINADDGTSFVFVYVNFQNNKCQLITQELIEEFIEIISLSLLYSKCLHNCATLFLYLNYMRCTRYGSLICLMCSLCLVFHLNQCIIADYFNWIPPHCAEIALSPSLCSTSC